MKMICIKAAYGNSGTSERPPLDMEGCRGCMHAVPHKLERSPRSLGGVCYREPARSEHRYDDYCICIEYREDT